MKFRFIARFAVLVALLDTRAASAQDQPPVGSDIVDCGGWNERPCDALRSENEARFIRENGSGVCDRGLTPTVDGCINVTRRQNVGKAFRGTWEGRTLAFQREVLGADRGYGSTTGITVHNAFENTADGYNLMQAYSITEMLDAGFHQIELDVWSDAPRAPKLCHRAADAGVCAPTDRMFASAMKEIRDWMLEPGHETAKVFILLDGQHVTARPLMDKAIETYLDIPGIGVYKGAERWTGFSQPVSTDPHEDWPTLDEMQEGDRQGRVLITELNGHSTYTRREDYSNPSVADMRNSHFRSWPHCDEDGTPDRKPLNPYARPGDQFTQYYPAPLAELTRDEIMGLTNCGFDSIKLNNLLQLGYDDNVGYDEPWSRLRGAIFSWGVASPPDQVASGTAARINITDGVSQPRWDPRAPGEEYPYLCVEPSAKPIHDRPVYSIVGKGKWAGGFKTCEDQGLEFATPRNGYDNLLARDKLLYAPGNPGHAWMSLQNIGGGDAGWKVRNGRATIRLVDGSFDFAMGGEAYDLITNEFRVDTDLLVDSVEWRVTEGPVGADWEVGTTEAHDAQIVFSKPGEYRLQATVTFAGGAQTTVVKTISVASWLAVAIWIPTADAFDTIDAIEGETLSGWIGSAQPVQSVECPTGVAAGLTPVTSGPSPLTFFECAIPVGAVTEGQLTVNTVGGAGYRWPSLSKTYIVNIADRQAPTVSAPNIEADDVGSFAQTFTLDDTPGEQMTLTVHWPDGDQVVASVPGQVTLSHSHFEAGSQTITMSVSDGVRTTESSFTLKTSRVPPTATITGPLYPLPGEEQIYTVLATSPYDLPSPFRRYQASCGPAGEIVSFKWMETAAHTTRLVMACSFTQGAQANAVFVTVSDPVSGKHATATMHIWTPSGPVSSIAEASAPPQKNEILTGVLFPGIRKSYDITVRPALGQDPHAVNPTCGSGADMDGMSITFHDSLTNVYVFRLRCMVKPDATTTTVSVAFKDDLGLVGNTVTITGIRAIDVVITPPAPVVAPTSSTVPVTFLVSGPVQSVNSATCGEATVLPTPVVSDGAVTLHCPLPATAGRFLAGLTLENEHYIRSATAIIDVEAPDTTPPTLSLPSDLIVEATAPATIVTWSSTASDDVDGDLPVTCSPASGTAFPLGTTHVSCAAEDAARNIVSDTFTVLVIDATAPILTVPAPISAGTTTTAGAAVSFTASATDKVEGAVAVTCAPASGTTFPVGITSVACSATDAFGNRASAAFTVSVSLTRVATSGEMTGSGSVRNDDARYLFGLLVRERPRDGERGHFDLRVDRNDGARSRGGLGRDDVFTARTVAYVAFSDDGQVSVIFSGEGTWNGAPGYRYEVQAADGGRAGRIRIVIKSPAGAVVAGVDGELDRGQIRSSGR